jgi:sec-independent protein translocase protein TatA
MPFVGHLPELIIIMLLALLIFGPKRLPEMGSAVGKTIKDFQRSMKENTESAEVKAPESQIAAPPTANEPATK